MTTRRVLLPDGPSKPAEQRHPALLTVKKNNNRVYPFRNAISAHFFGGGGGKFQYTTCLQYVFFFRKLVLKLRLHHVFHGGNQGYDKKKLDSIKKKRRLENQTFREYRTSSIFARRHGCSPAVVATSHRQGGLNIPCKELSIFSTSQLQLLSAVGTDLKWRRQVKPQRVTKR